MKSLLLHHPRLLLALTAAALLASAGRAQDEDSVGSTARVKFSDPAKPGTLKFSIPWAEARITGTDGDEIVVTSSLGQKDRAAVDDEGFRRLDDEATFELEEKDNVAAITIAGENLWSSHGAEFEILVPRNTSLVLRAQQGGDIVVEGVEGDIDINSMNGEVVLRDIASSAVVNTMNGEIRATFKRAPDKPVSLSSMNGEIDVRLPSDTKANLRMRTHNGSIRTNFPAGVLNAKTEKAGRSSNASSNANSDSNSDSDSSRGDGSEMAREQARLGREHAQMAKEIARATRDAIEASVEASVQASVDASVNGVHISIPPMPPMPPMPNFGGKSIVGTLNGGGVDIKLTSMNGTITLREAK